LFSIAGSIHRDAHGLAHQGLERRNVTMRRPELQFGVPSYPYLQEIVISPIAQLEFRDDLRVAALQSFSETKQRG
jgi:hypothetical protein